MTEQRVTEERRFTCKNEQRRHKVREAGLNGLDYLDVIDPLTLRLYFLGKAPSGLTRENVRIVGGERVQGIQVTRLRTCTREESHLDDCVVITLDKTGDFSTYTLCLVALDEDGKATEAPYPGLDVRYSCLDFSFKTGCAGDMDCLQTSTCPPDAIETPNIDYLAKDYAGFRQLILDRLALLMPDWQERHVPDQAIALIEILAYVGDHLSYYQDAVATEAYLQTARRRISVRRHARLVDYRMHEGCNARAWVHVRTAGDTTLAPAKLAFITGYNQALSVPGRVLEWDDLTNIPADRYEVFEPLVANPKQEIDLYQAHNAIRFWSWGDRECCLPQGATRATLVDGKGTLIAPDDGPSPTQQGPPQKPDQQEPEPSWTYERELNLDVGDVLIFEEIKGPSSSKPADADPNHRHVVRLTRVDEAVDELYHQPVLEISWARADALPFPLCISALGTAEAGCPVIEDISVARGNVILVDHGQHVHDETLGEVPCLLTESTCEREGRPTTPRRVAGRFRPRLSRTPVTFRRFPSDEIWEAPASEILAQDPRAALPTLTLTSVPPAPEAPVPLFPPEALTSPERLRALAGELRQADDSRETPEHVARQQEDGTAEGAGGVEQDSTTQYLRGSLSDETRELLDGWDGTSSMPSRLSQALMSDLGGLLHAWDAHPDLLASRRGDRQ
jgi:hypothetical protein